MAAVLEGLMERTRSRSAVAWFVVAGLGFRVVRAWDLGIGVQGIGFSDWGLGFRV